MADKLAVGCIKGQPVLLKHQGMPLADTDSAHHDMCDVQTELSSFLMEITSLIFGKKDDQKDDGWLLDVIKDQTGMKGTGMPYPPSGQPFHGQTQASRLACSQHFTALRQLCGAQDAPATPLISCYRRACRNEHLPG